MEENEFEELMAKKQNIAKIYRNTREQEEQKRLNNLLLKCKNNQTTFNYIIFDKIIKAILGVKKLLDSEGNYYISTTRGSEPGVLTRELNVYSSDFCTITISWSFSSRYFIEPTISIKFNVFNISDINFFKNVEEIIKEEEKENKKEKDEKKDEEAQVYDELFKTCKNIDRNTLKEIVKYNSVNGHNKSIIIAPDTYNMNINPFILETKELDRFGFEVITSPKGTIELSVAAEYLDDKIDELMRNKVLSFPEGWEDYVKRIFFIYDAIDKKETIIERMNEKAYKYFDEYIKPEIYQKLFQQYKDNQDVFSDVEYEIKLPCYRDIFDAKKEDIVAYDKDDYDAYAIVTPYCESNEEVLYVNYQDENDKINDSNIYYPVKLTNIKYLVERTLEGKLEINENKIHIKVNSVTFEDKLINYPVKETQRQL